MNPSRGAQNQEYLLQGSIHDDSVELLIHKLRGMCDCLDEGVTKFKEHDIVYSMKEPNGQTVSVRVKKPLSHPEQPWMMIYVGQPEVGDKSRPTTVRTCVEVNCTPNVCSFLQELGFTLDYEYLSHGWMFHRNRLKIVVTKLSKIVQGNVDQSLPLSKSHLVEVSTLSSAGHDQAPIEVQSFSEQLKPLINLDKFDPRSMRH